MRGAALTFSFDHSLIFELVGKFSHFLAVLSHSGAVYNAPSQSPAISSLSILCLSNKVDSTDTLLAVERTLTLFCLDVAPD